VVATAFETEAKSKTVAMVIGGEAVSKVNRPNAFSATNFPWQETAMEAAGKAACAMPFWMMSNAVAKIASCCSRAGAGK